MSSYLTPLKLGYINKTHTHTLLYIFHIFFHPHIHRPHIDPTSTRGRLGEKSRLRRENNKNCGGGKSRMRRRWEKIKIVEKEGMQE